MNFDALMQEALGLAEQAVGLSEPNPRVGCVIVAPDARMIGRGHTQQAGGPHAEVMALRDAAARGEDVREPRSSSPWSHALTKAGPAPAATAPTARRPAASPSPRLPGPRTDLLSSLSSVPASSGQSMTATASISINAPGIASAEI